MANSTGLGSRGRLGRDPAYPFAPVPPHPHFFPIMWVVLVRATSGRGGGEVCGAAGSRVKASVCCRVCEALPILAAPAAHTPRPGLSRAAKGRQCPSKPVPVLLGEGGIPFMAGLDPGPGDPKKCVISYFIIYTHQGHHPITYDVRGGGEPAWANRAGARAL